MKSLVTLPDGSKVKLNSESHLEYYSDFEHERSVKLVGEAFFEIVEDTLRPFYVNTGDLRVRVLGTTFNVEAFPFEKTINIALVTGKVLIERKEGLEIKHVNQLSPNEMLIYEHQSAQYDIAKFETKSVTGWKDGELHLDEPDFHSVVKKLERWYGVEIMVESTADLSGRFEVSYFDQPLDVVLEGIGFMSGFEYERIGKKIIIK
jgi:ferric-dicitrate binding protein FerR (iron transport regulator)